MQAYTGLSRGGLWEPRGQHLRRQGSDPAWTRSSSSSRGDPGSRSDSRLRCCLYYCGGRLCLDYVRPCADRHRVGRLAIVYKRALCGDTCVTCCIGNHSMARIIVPIQSCSRPRGLHRRPDECHSGSWSWRLNYTVRRGGVHYRTGQPFGHHWSSCDRCRSTADTCHCRGAS